MVLTAHTPRHRVLLLLRPLLTAVGVLVLVFALCELVERLWLRSLDAGAVHAWHITRGLLMAAAVAAVMSWWIVRRSPPLLPSALPGGLRGALAARRQSQARRQRNLARWLIRMRWLAVVVVATLVVAAVPLAHLLPAQTWTPLLATVAALAVSNVLYTLLLRRGRRLHALLLVQVYIDLVLFIVLLQFSGGIENPMALLMLLQVIVAGIVLNRRQCYEVALFASVLFALLALGEFLEVLPHYALLLFPHPHDAHGVVHAAHEPLFVLSRVVLQCALLFLTAYFVSSLTERLHRNERQLEDLAVRALADHHLLMQALATTATGLRVLDEQLHSQWANDIWKSWFGAPAGNPTPGCTDCAADGRLCGAVTPLESPCAAQRTFADGQVHLSELPWPPGAAVAERTFQLTTAPLRDRQGRVTQVVELVQDITSQKRAQAQMMQASRLATVGELAGQVAHEVNNPLAIIGAKARLLLSDPQVTLPAKVDQELRKIVTLSDRVARIAQGLLSYGRPTTAQRTALDLRGPVDRAAAMIEQRARQAGVTVEVAAPAELPMVWANAGELEQVFLNLLLNALDAMPQGGQVTVTLTEEENGLGPGRPSVNAAVADTGAGIPAALHEKIFEPFFSTKQEGKGTGLGLSICQGLVHSHGGRIEVSGAAGRGTCLTVKIPVAVRNAQEPSHA